MEIKRLFILKRINPHNFLEGKPEMQELKLQLDGTHERDCKKPGEALITG